jgi:hypothetical protein
MSAVADNPALKYLLTKAPCQAFTPTPRIVSQKTA